jgi:hypothetical protein
LVYEYSEESSNYGLVKISGNNVKELPDYDALKTAFSKTSNPKGDGDYNSTGGANPCPAKNSPSWDVDNDSLPAMPAPAKKYLTQGAGKGKGFSGSGSMEAGTQSTGTAAPGSGSVSEDSSSSGSSGGASSSAAAVAVKPIGLSTASMVMGLVTALSTLFGASLVLL